MARTPWKRGESGLYAHVKEDGHWHCSIHGDLGPHDEAYRKSGSCLFG